MGLADFQETFPALEEEHRVKSQNHLKKDNGKHQKMQCLNDLVTAKNGNASSTGAVERLDVLSH